MQVVGYGRTSPHGTDDLSHQREMVEKWAEINDHELIEWFEEENCSGFRNRPIERPVIKKMLDFIEENLLVKAIVVYRYSRFGVTAEGLKGPTQYFREVQGREVELVSVTQNHIPALNTWVDILESELETWERAFSNYPFD